MNRPFLSVIMPAYNEGPRIQDSILRTHRELSLIAPSFQIVAVDDGSRDTTGSLLEETTRTLDHVTVVRLPVNSGKGEAIRQGFYRALGKYIFFLDSDMDLPPEQMKVFLQTLEEEGSDIVIGSKMHPQSKIDYPTHRRMMSLIYYSIVRILFGLPVRDTQTGMKLFRREVLEHVMPRMLVKTFAFDLELLVIAHHLGYRISEAPVIIQFQPKFGNIPLEVMRATANDTLAVFYRLHILHFYDTHTSPPDERS